MHQQKHSLSFLDVRTWRELLAHRLALCDREDKLLRHLHTFVGQIEYPPMVPPLPDKAHLWDGIGTAAIDENVAIFDYGRQFVEEELSSEQIDQAITALAQFHAFSMESPQLCGANTVPTLSHPKPENEMVIKEWLLDVLLTLPECNYFQKNEHSLRNFLQKVGFGFKDEQIGAYSHKELPIVLCHGNFCVNNIVFCSTDTKCVGKSPADTLSPIILSWELAHPGHGISDVVHLLLSSVNSSVRLQRQDQWIALYVHKFEQFIQLQRKQNRSGKSSMQQMLARKKTMENAVKQQKQKFRALLPGQLLRVLPKLAMEYRKLAKTAQLNSEQIGQYNWKRCALLGRMIGGFEMVRKDFEKK